MTKIGNWNICKECGSHCCSYGGTAVTKLELEEILEAGHQNHFVKISENCYVTKWGEDGICPYLQDTSCTIYDVQPILCQKFPIVTFDNREHFLAHCPLTEQLSEEHLWELAKLASKCPDELLEGANLYLEPYGEILEERLRRFKMDIIELDNI